MSGDALKVKIANLNLEPKSGHALLGKLIEKGFFDAPVSSSDVLTAVREKFGKTWRPNYPHVYSEKFLQNDILQVIKTKDGYFFVVTTVSREDALRKIGKSKKVADLEERLFSDALMGKLSAAFKIEIDELHDNFGKNGNSTAFLLRKILEKLLIIVMAKHGRQALLEKKGQSGRWVGLEEMIDIAMGEKIGGVPILMSRTGKEVKGIKFLGDTAAHNPLADVDMKTIIPQMPYIITAYEELAKRL